MKERKIMEKGSGVLLHISSLPSPYGIGTFGLAARRFVRFLKLSGQKYWQILPINPTSFGDSPYQSPSTFAINPYFIDIDLLINKGYLKKDEVKAFVKKSNNRKVNYSYLFQTRLSLFRIAYPRIYEKENAKIERFYKKQKYWIEDYALFMAIKEHYNNDIWTKWPNDLKLHKKNALEKTKKELYDDYLFYVTLQYIAYMQYRGLKRYANKNGVKIIGDIPIYVAFDSVDVWSHRNEFLFDKRNNPTLVAGVPPDYFSKTGQLWGNPIYNYQKMEKNDFKWWRKRIARASKLYDVVRIDHFRGFASYYGISYGEETAINGTWYKGPGKKIIDAINISKGKTHIVAEDLGIIDDEVKKLLKYSNYPGLKVLQFAFSGELTNPFLPHNYEANSVAYLGTHDNDVMTNFIDDNEEISNRMCNYFACDKKNLLDKCIDALLNSNADVTIFQMQDILKLKGNVRMNCPGTSSDNWTFRILKKDLNKEVALQMYERTCIAGRY